MPEYIFIIVMSLAIITFIYIKVRNVRMILSVTSLFRGNRTERNLILKLRKMGFDSGDLFHDLYVAKPNGKYSQVDAVAVTDYGIIVFEVKNYKGWIFGNGYDSLWTQTFPNGKKNKFYNPILQNKGHVESLKRGLKRFGNIPFYSVIVFYGPSELKDITFIPDNAFIAKSDKLKKVLKHISRQNPQYEYSSREAVIDFLDSCTSRGEDFGIVDEHIDNIKESLGRDKIFD